MKPVKKSKFISSDQKEKNRFVSYYIYYRAYLFGWISGNMGLSIFLYKIYPHSTFISGRLYSFKYSLRVQYGSENLTPCKISDNTI